MTRDPKSAAVRRQAIGRADCAFFHRRRVRYHEIDAQKVVYNSHYLTFFDVALTEFMRGKSHDSNQDAPSHDFHVVHASVDYARSVRFDAQIDIGVRVARLGRSSIRFELGIFSAEDTTDAAAVYASGALVWVWTDQKTAQPTPLPAPLRKQLEALV